MLNGRDQGSYHTVTSAEGWQYSAEGQAVGLSGLHVEGPDYDGHSWQGADMA